MSSARRNAVVAATLLLATTALPVHATYFRVAPTLPLPGPALARQTDSIAGDFNEDGRADLMVGYWKNSNVGFGMSVFLATGPGTFGPPIPVSPAPLSITQAVTTDFNGDGHLDIAMTSQRVAWVLLGDGTGHFAVSIVGGDGDYGFLRLSGAAAADVDGDGKLDFVSTQQSLVPATQARLWVRRGNGAGAFSPATTYPLGTSLGYAGQIAARDLNGDGHVDVVVAEEVDGVAVVLNNGAGGFGAPMFLTSGPLGNGGPRILACADLNADGKLDLAVASSAPASLQVFLGNGSGGFGAPLDLPSPSAFFRTGSLVVADFDLDGHLDMALTLAGLWFYRGDGAGGFSVAARFGLAGHSSLADLDADGKLDLAVGRSLLINHGNWDFAGQRQFATGLFPRALAAGDMNGDGKLDLVVANGASADVAVLLGNGDGSFGPPLSTPVYTSTGALALADFDGNGTLDVALTDLTLGTVSILLGNGAGGLVTHTSFVEGLEPTGIAAGDLNDDGRADLVVSNFQSSSARVYLGNGTGSFTSLGTYPLPARGRTVALAALNPDFRPDALVGLEGSAAGTAAAVLLGTGGGGFLPASPVGGAGSLPVYQDVVSLSTGDFDGDGNLDLLSGGSQLVAVLIGDGAGHFRVPGFYIGGETIFYGSYSIWVAAGDFNRDGKLDAVTDDVGLLIGGGDGTLGLFGDRFEVGDYGTSVVAGDFDGDGHPDLAVGMSQANGVTILLNKPGEPGADLAVSMTHFPDPAAPFADVTVTLAIANQGPLPATGAVLRVDLSLGASFVSSVPGPPSCVMEQSSPSAPQYLVCSLGDLASGANTMVSLVEHVNQSFGNMTLVAHVTSTPPDPDPFDSDVTHVIPVGAPEDLAVAMSDSADPVSPGEGFSYQVSVANVGAGAMDGLGLLRVTLPSQVSFVSAVPPNCSGGSVLNCGFSPLAAGANTEFTINVLAGTFTSIRTTAEAFGDPFVDTNPSNNTAEEETRGVLGTTRELGHGSALSDSFPPATPSERLYYLEQQPHSSYEIVVDGTAGDVAGTGQTLLLQRLGVDLLPLQDAQAAGTGPSRSLRFENLSDEAVHSEVVRARSTGCGATCGPDAAYRVRAWDTTARIPRFNTVGSQTTLLVLENAGGLPLHAHVWLWDEVGALVGSQALLLNGHQATTLNLATIVPGCKGTVTISHDGPYGALQGKGVGIEPATGFVFDTALQYRPR